MNLVISGFDISNKVTSYQSDATKYIDSNLSFTTSDGKRHYCFLGIKHKLSVTVEDLTDTEHTALLSALAPNEIPVTYNGKTGTFHGESAPSELFYSDSNGNRWDVSFSFEEV